MSGELYIATLAERVQGLQPGEEWAVGGGVGPHGQIRVPTRPSQRVDRVAKRVVGHDEVVLVLVLCGIDPN